MSSVPGGVCSAGGEGRGGGGTLAVHPGSVVSCNANPVGTKSLGCIDLKVTGIEPVLNIRILLNSS